MRTQIRVSRFAVSLLLLLSSGIAQATSDNQHHELGVYSLWQYGEHEGRHWKTTVEPERPEEDPAQVFWDIMTGGTSSDYAYHTSRKRVNDQVNYHTVFPIPGDGWKDWDQFDMVFFYGHNNMITPPHPVPGSFWIYYDMGCPSGFWTNDTGLWERKDCCYVDWGTTLCPYEYYYMDVTTGQEHPGSVTYLYEPFTSVLLGYQFQPSRVSTYQITAQDTPDVNSPGTTGTFASGLGTNDLEWLILHGCQAVIVADRDGTYNPMGVDAFRRTWDGFHIILGHYRTYSGLTDLSEFAY